MKISREVWQQINPLLTDALDMEKSAREAWIHILDQTHPQLSPLLRKLLTTHDRAERSQDLETEPRLAPAPRLTATFPPVRALVRSHWGARWDVAAWARYGSPDKLMGVSNARSPLSCRAFIAIAVEYPLDSIASAVHARKSKSSIGAVFVAFIAWKAR